MIRLTEVFWEKGMKDFGTRPVSVNVDHIMRMAPTTSKLKGTPQYVNVICADNVPERCQRTISSMDVTEIIQSDGSSIDVKETLDEIDMKIYNSVHNEES